MANGHEMGKTWYEKITDEALAYVSSEKKLDDGEAATVDNGFVFAYDTRINNRNQRVGKAVLVIEKGVPVYSGPDSEHLEEHIFRPDIDGPLDSWQFKVSPKHSIVVVGERLLRIVEVPIGSHGFQLRMNSDTQFFLERIGMRLRISDMKSRLEERLHLTPQV